MHIRYAVVSEFDLGKGADVKGQYPTTPTLGSGLAPLLIPDGVHARADDWTFFPLWEESNGSLHVVPKSNEGKKLYVCNYVRSVFSDEIKRGSSIRTIAIITPEPAFTCLKPLFMAFMNHDTKNPQPAVELARRLFECVDGIDTSTVPRYSWYEKRLLDTKVTTALTNVESADATEASTFASSLVPGTHFVSLVTRVSDDTEPVTIYMPTFTDHYSAGSFSVRKIANACLTEWKCRDYDLTIMPFSTETPVLIALWLSVLAGKRILIYGDSTGISCNKLCEIVFGCSYLLSAEGLLDTHCRVYPSVDLNAVDELEQLRDRGGFLAGSTNAAFLLHPEWYDVILRLDTKELCVSHSVKGGTQPLQKPKPKHLPPFLPEDTEFIQSVLALTKDAYNETKIREKCCAHFESILRRAQIGKQALMTCDMKAFSRIYGLAADVWRELPSYEYYIERVQRESLLQDQICRLYTGSTDAPDLYRELQLEVVSNDDVTRLLLIPEAVYYVSLGLFHRNPVAREAALSLIHRIQKHVAGAQFCATLPPIHRRGLEMLEQTYS